MSDVVAWRRKSQPLPDLVEREASTTNVLARLSAVADRLEGVYTGLEPFLVALQPADPSPPVDREERP